MAVVVKWNGNDLPEELRSLPAGRYVVESVDAAPTLTPEEEDGLQSAIDSIERGDALESSEVRKRIKTVLEP